MPNRTVTLQTTDIITAVDGDYPICDAAARKAIAGNFSYYYFTKI